MFILNDTITIMYTLLGYFMVWFMYIQVSKFQVCYLITALKMLQLFNEDVLFIFTELSA